MTATDKQANFKKLGSKRTQRALDSIRLLANLAGSNYESTPEQRELIFTTLRAAVDASEAAFSTKSKSADSFTL